jgi:hypothetical protein
MAIDPGLRTGVAIGSWAAGARTPADIEISMSYTLGPEPDEVAQARELATLWFDVRSQFFPNVDLVIEDFILIRLNSSARSGISPARVAAALQGYRAATADVYERQGYGPTAPIDVVWQQPGQAKGFATDSRLRHWGLWVKGTHAAHQRDAIRHIALRFATFKERKTLEGTNDHRAQRDRASSARRSRGSRRV